jgi:hypothetical protein
MKLANNWIIRLTGLGFVAFCGGSSFAISSETLFVVARNTNANEIHYVANIGAKRALDLTEPVSAYWIMVAEDGHRENLTWFENGHAYGFSVQQDAKGNSVVMTIKAMDKFPIRVALVAGIVRAEAKIGGSSAFLEKVFIRMSGGLFPGIDSITLFGEDPTTGLKVQGVLRP